MMSVIPRDKSNPLRHGEEFSEATNVIVFPPPPVNIEELDALQRFILFGQVAGVDHRKEK